MRQTGLRQRIKKTVASKWFIGPVALLLLLGGAKVVSNAYSAKQSTEKTVEQPVRRGDIKIDFVGDGQISLPVKNLDFEVRGKIKNIWVMPGQTVKQGDKLAELDVADYDDQVAKAQIDYEKAQVSLRNAAQQSGLSLLTDQAKWISALNGVGSIQAANLGVQAAKNSLETAKDNVAKGILTAPANGKILYISKSIGDTTGGVLSTTDNTTADSTDFLAFLDSNQVYVKSSISETDINNISMGQAVEASVEAVGDEPLKGKVVAIDNMPKVDSNGVVTYDVTAQLNTANDQLKEGMTAVLSFIVKEKDNVLTIPNQAVKTAEGRQYVELKDENGQIVQKPVQTGLSDGEQVEVISGLAQGDTVVIREAGS